MRLPHLTPAELTDAQRAVHDAIASGPRAAGPQHFPLVDASGALTGPFAVMVHEPALGAPLQELGSALRHATGLTDRVREIAILTVAAATGSAFERYAHTRVGRAVGLTDDELEALAAQTFTSTDPAEATAYDLCRRLLDGRSRLTEAAYEGLVEVLGTGTLTELVVLVGYYRTLAQLLDVFDVGVPEEAGPQ
jgi:4-carboxymuconolactone decarboxylase